MRAVRAPESWAGLVRKASELTDEVAGLGADRMLPAPPELRDLLPDRGLKRGTTVALDTRPGVAGRTTLLLALLATVTQAGSWCALVGMPTVGLAAAADLGVDLTRLALVPRPGSEWAAVVSVLLEGFDLVAVVPGHTTAAARGQLAARARQRGSVLMPLAAWDGADIVLGAQASRWHGLGVGNGRLRWHELTITSAGRGAAARPKRATFWPHGQPEPGHQLATVTDLSRRSASPAPRTPHASSPAVRQDDPAAQYSGPGCTQSASGEGQPFPVMSG